MVGSGLTVEGLREFHVLCEASGPIAKRELDETLRDVAEPVRASAESLAVSGIVRVGIPWSRMRVGVTRRAVYVAPQKRGSRRRTARSRPNFARLMEQRAMTPALEQNKPLIEQRVNAAFEQLAARWNALG